jgi:chaperonin cofactor prefoldin
MCGKISELEALNLEKDKRIATLEAEMKQLKEEYKAETDKIRRAFAEAVVNF